MNSKKTFPCASPGLLKTLLFAILLQVFHPLTAQEPLLCMGAYWTEDDANLMMKTFASSGTTGPPGRNGQK
jgi:hypothetical protein